MCPECKCRERRKLVGNIDFPNQGTSLRRVKGVTIMDTVYVPGLRITANMINRLWESFFCSDCGYEIGRYG